MLHIVYCNNLWKLSIAQAASNVIAFNPSRRGGLKIEIKSESGRQLALADSLGILVQIGALTNSPICVSQSSEDNNLNVDKDKYDDCIASHVKVGGWNFSYVSIRLLAEGRMCAAVLGTTSTM